MQFHAPSQAHGPSTIPVGSPDTASTRSLETESVLLPVQPGRLNTLKQHVPQAKPRPQNNQRDGKALLKPEPINYLQRRRTDASVRALGRNRTQHVVTHEILQPSASSPTRSPPKKPLENERLVERLEALERMDHALAEMHDLVLQPGNAKVNDTEKPSALLASQLQQLYREQAQVHNESEAATKKVQELLTVVRNDISLMYKFTPLFKIYARHKTKSAWRHWTEYVVWHRDEQARFALLWPYAVTIQRVFRTKRSRWQRARMRMALAWQQWQASLCVQRSVRAWLARRERDRLAEAREATKLQAAWRGRRDRRLVKKLLQDQLRWMLRSLTPTGNLHRLHEVTQHYPELARPLNAMLSLIEETTVAVDSNTAYKANNAHIAAKITAKPVEATRAQLFHAVFELSEIIRNRERAVQEAKAAYNAKKDEKQKRQQQHEEEVKARELLVVREKITSGKEREKMQQEEMLTREFLRMLKTAESDRILHLKLDQSRREQAENARMVVEEYQIRYLASEFQRRRLEDERRLWEVEKRQQFLLEQDELQTQQLMELLKTDEMKRNESRTKRLQAKAEENVLWSKMSKEQQAEAMRRLELKEQLEEEERKRSEALIFAQQAHQREINRKREESRLQKQAELERELAARAAMEREEKLSKKAHFEAKKAMHAETWKTKREKEQARYSLDPMHFDKVQSIKQLEERERRERYLMKIEDGIMAQIHERERKEKYFEQCRQRRQQEKTEAARAGKEKVALQLEDSLAESIRALDRKAEEHKAMRVKMAALATQDELRRAQRVLEARNRRDMYNEEMLQRRIMQSIQMANELKEKRERELMEQEEIQVCSLTIELKQKADKRFREQNIFRMMREDVASMERQDWEEEGHRLEQLLWAPEDAVAFSTLVTDYPQFLVTNVTIVKELCGLKGPPPFDFDYEAVQRYRREESNLPLDQVPRKKRKSRKFFYHEFFENDPILSKYKPVEAPPSKARQRWRMVAEHFFGQAWSDDSVRQAYLLMSEQKYPEAAAALLDAVRMVEASSCRFSSSSLLRRVARCYVAYWENCFERSCLERSLFFFQRATTSLGALTNPQFLQEFASVLEKLTRYREAAEIISGIIQCFPRYPKLNDVIFRGGIVMISLGMYQQSREYLLHTLDASPFGWEPHEILLLAARVMELEGKPRRKLCAVAYEEAFRKNKKDAYYRLYPTWQEWLQNADAWRDIGDRYFAKQEFALARDAYRVMMKRIFKVKAQRGNLKNTRDGPPPKLDDSDWLRVARCAAILNDRDAAASALKRWFARKSYRDRVLEQFYKWPLGRWKLLGVDVPERVVEVLAEKKREAQEAEEAKLKAIEDKRRNVLRQRSVKARERLIAWGDDPPTTKTVEEVQPPQPRAAAPAAQIGPWRRIVDDDTNEVYYWNKETNDVAWDAPTV